MSWRTVKVEEQRNLFINAYLEHKFNISDLCKQFNISRPCAYKWIKRHASEGLSGLKDRSRRPHSCPTATPNAIKDEILKVKFEWKKWGPKKILGYLSKNFADRDWPCLTTVENILKEAGLVERRKLRRRFAKRNDPLSDCNASNDVWCIDFKGWWITADGLKHEPFTLMDAYSRYLLCCHKLQINDHTHVWGVFERVFREYGLPLRIRSDNGAPFATVGAGRLSRLSINLIKAGVIPEWIEPGKPQQNGRHERMHLTLKNEGMDVSLDSTLQSRKLEEFISYYNFIRPHEAIGQQCPGEIYRPSLRIWDGRLRVPEYPSDFKIGRVRSCGTMELKGKRIYVGRVFEYEHIGLKDEDGILKAYYGPVFLGFVNGNTVDFERRPGRKRN